MVELGNKPLGSLNRGEMFNPGTWSVGGKVILAMAVAGDIINKVSKESSGRPSE